MSKERRMGLGMTEDEILYWKMGREREREREGGRERERDGHAWRP